jgi:hypothetical protein
MRAPRPANCSAAICPMPAVAPVMTTTLPRMDASPIQACMHLEFNVIKDWLEIEVGAAKLFGGSEGL